MKLSQIPYTRPDTNKLKETVNNLSKEFSAAQSFQAQLEIFKKFEAEKGHYLTYSVLSNIRNSMDVTDEFYKKEKAFFDAESPLVNQCFNDFYKEVLNSKFKDCLKAELGEYFFDCMEMQQKAYSPIINDLLAEENELSTQYESLYANAKINFDGKVLNVPQLAAYKQSADRQIRKAAVEAEGRFFDENREVLDEIYDKLVKNRHSQAVKLGFKNYVELAYLRKNRFYSPEDVAKFRNEVLSVMVPENVKYKKQQAENIGIADFKFYDNDFFFADGNPKPKCSVKEMLNRAQELFSNLSSETKELVDLMMENELFDIETRPGKRTGGYCTTITDYGYPFIFSNSNGTDGDVKTLMHETGHAFASYTAQKNIPYISIRHAPMEACETHSMSMEFLSSPWHNLFFGEDSAKFSLSHALGTLYFVPYGVIVDYFQELVYSNPDWTPEERNQAWLKLENQFRPYIDFDSLPFYSRGGGWQRQIHIYCLPFYYIDYSIAQTLALQFFAMYLKDPKSAWEKYYEFVKIGGTKNIKDTIAACGMTSPFEEGTLKQVCQPVYDWINGLTK